MDDLSKFKFENLNDESLKEIQSLSVEQLKELKNEKGILIIRNKKTNQKGQSNYSNLIVLEGLGMRSRYEVVGFKHSSVKTEYQVPNVNHEIIQQEVIDEFVSPELPLINENNDDFQLETFEEEPKKRGRKPKNNN